MNKILKAMLSAFHANVDFHATIDKELPKMSAAQRKVFVIDAANALAGAASARWEEEIRTYDGQRGIAFGVWNAEEKKMVRTAACDATRKWFQRNIVVKFNPIEPKVAPSAVWTKIVEEITTAKKIASKLEGAKQRQFMRDLAALIAEYEVE